MTIPESQLSVWAKQGATAPATALYERIRNALRADPVLQQRAFDVFLQGSYRNSTNIHGESDVDVVAMLQETYMPDYSQLLAYARTIVESRATSATYQLADFRRDVSVAIRRAFPNHAVTEGGESIKVPRTANNIPADIVPCLEYRLYVPPPSLLAEAPHVDGIWLQDTQRHHEVVSFPQWHYDNGVSKHARTHAWFKPTVRVFKNARCWLEDQGMLEQDSAPSFAVECLVYNVPDDLFGDSYQSTFTRAVDWLASARLAGFVCQNGIQELFREGGWSEPKARQFIKGLVQMWHRWGQDARLRV